jgi:rhamnosyltransferase
LHNKIVVGFVIFNESSEFSNKINLLVEYGCNVYIYDNSPELSYPRDSIGYKDGDNVHYMTCGHNIGLGVAMSTICAQAYFDGNEHLLFFDQDTVFSVRTLDFVFKTLLTLSVKKYSAISLSNDGGSNVLYDSDCSSIIDETMLIRNSGSIFALPILNKIGWFNVSYFVDGVDYEFSLRSSLNGYKVGVVSPVPDFDHETEQGNNIYSIFWLTLVGRKYPASRIIDVIRSSARLIVYSIGNLRPRFALVILGHVAAFMMKQILIRVSKVI